MRKILLFVMAIAMSVILSAQEYVTTFMGIPVDGTKKEMVKKLKKIGFKPNNTYSKKFLDGEFNGRVARVYVVTNKEKVYRIMVADANTTDEIGIINRFNDLYWQFMYNKKYEESVFNDGAISRDEDISYEMSVNKKQYEACFYQLPGNSSENIDYNNTVWFKIAHFDGKYYICLYYDNGYNMSDGEDL